MEAAGSYAELMLSNFMSRPEAAFVKELSALNFLSDEFMSLVLLIVLGEIAREQWPESDVFMFFSKAFSRLLLGSVSFEVLSQILHKTLDLPDHHLLALLTKSLWRSCKALICKVELEVFMNTISRVSDNRLIVKAIREDNILRDLLKNGLPFPAINQKVMKEHMDVLSKHEQIFEDALSKVRSILRRKKIWLENI